MAASSMRSGSSAAVTAVVLLTALHGHAETPAALCRRVGTDDATRPIPEALVPAVNTAFGIQMPASVAMYTTVFRCSGGRVTVCTVGANLPCGKANISRTPRAGELQWCRDNPGS